MSTYSRIHTLPLGSEFTGYTVTWRLYAIGDLSTVVSSGSASEVAPDLETGSFVADISRANGFRGVILWIIGSSSPIYTVEPVDVFGDEGMEAIAAFGESFGKLARVAAAHPGGNLSLSSDRSRATLYEFGDTDNSAAILTATMTDTTRTVTPS